MNRTKPVILLVPGASDPADVERAKARNVLLEFMSNETYLRMLWTEGFFSSVDVSDDPFFIVFSGTNRKASITVTVPGEYIRYTIDGWREPITTNDELVACRLFRMIHDFQGQQKWINRIEGTIRDIRLNEWLR